MTVGIFREHGGVLDNVLGKISVDAIPVVSKWGRLWG